MQSVKSVFCTSQLQQISINKLLIQFSGVNNKKFRQAGNCSRLVPLYKLIYNAGRKKFFIKKFDTFYFYLETFKLVTKASN